MKKIILSNIIFFSALLIIWSCEKEEPMGPKLEDLFGSFRIIDSLKTLSSTIDFSKGDSAHFIGSWTTNSKWELKITGKTSGAVKTINGQSKNLDTAIATWDGTADAIFFKKEECEVQLTFDDNEEQMTTKIDVVGLHDYSKDGIIFNAYEGSTVEVWGGQNTLQESTNGQGALITDVNSPQGNKYLHLEGREPGSSTTAAWYIAGLPGFNASTILGTNYSHFPLTQEASSIYLNIFIKGFATPNTTIVFNYREDEGGSSESSYTFTKNISDDMLNWQLISIPLSDFISTDDKDGREISKIKVFYVSMNSTGNKTDNMEVAIDFIFLSQGKPLGK